MTMTTADFDNLCSFALTMSVTSHMTVVATEQAKEHNDAVTNRIFRIVVELSECVVTVRFMWVGMALESLVGKAGQ